MMDLKMEVYTPGLELVGMLEIFKYVIWEEKAFTAGNFSLQSIITDETRNLLVPDNIIWIEGDTAGIIEHIDQQAGDDGPYITVKGRTLTGILDRRILWGVYSVSGTIPEIMLYLVDDCCINPTRGDTEARKIPRLIITDNQPTGGAVVQLQKTGHSLLEYLEALGEAYNIAFGVRFVPAQPPAVPHMEFWCRPGENRSIHQNVNDHVFYSTELDDVLRSEYTYNSTNTRNIALVAGEGEGNNRTMVVVENDGTVQEISAVGFVALGDSSPMHTSDGKPIQVMALTAGGDAYQSAYTGAQIDEAVRRVLSGEVGGGTGTQGPQGPAGKDATINGVNAIEIKAGDGISLSLQNGILTISTTGGSGGASKPSRLPVGYTEVEFIKTMQSGFGINTGVLPNLSNTRFVLDVSNLTFTNAATDEYIFVANGTSISGTYRYFSLWLNSNTLISWRDAASNYNQKTADFTDKRLILDFNIPEKKFSVGDTVLDMTTGDYSITNPVYIGCNSTSLRSATFLLYSCQVYTGETKIRDFVPCYNYGQSLGTGLFDLVDMKFYGNSLNGAIIPGPPA